MTLIPLLECTYGLSLATALKPPVLEGQVVPLPVILARSGDRSVALQVDRVIGSREVVSKGLGPQFSDVSDISGATVLGDAQDGFEVLRTVRRDPDLRNFLSS